MPSLTARTAAALIPLTLILAGCGGGGGAAGGNNSSAVAEEAVAGNADADTKIAAKVNGYTEGYNKLIDTFGLSETAESYIKDGIATKTARDSISISDGWVDTATASLKEARALPGDMPALDRGADALIASLDKVLARLGPLNTYYESKAYKDDGLKRGKAEDAAMIAEFKAALAEADRFEGTLATARRARLDGELARLKDRGDTLGYNTKLELKHAEDLLALFKSPESVRDPARYAQGDALVATLDKLLAEQRTAFAAAKAKASPTEQPDYGHSSTVDSLTSMIGSYREMRESKNPEEFNNVVKEYNRAIESANRIS